MLVLRTMQSFLLYFLFRIWIKLAEQLRWDSHRNKNIHMQLISETSYYLQFVTHSYLKNTYFRVYCFNEKKKCLKLLIYLCFMETNKKSKLHTRPDKFGSFFVCSKLAEMTYFQLCCAVVNCAELSPDKKNWW